MKLAMTMTIILVHGYILNEDNCLIKIIYLSYILSENNYLII